MRVAADRTRSRRRRASVLAVLCFACIAALALWLAARAWEPKDVGTDDIIYWLAIPDDAKAIPLFEPCLEPRYSLVRQDGLSPKAVTIRYGARLSPAEGLQRYRTELEKRGCNTQTGQAALWAGSCAPPIDHVEIDVELRTSDISPVCNRVVVSFVGG